MRSAPTPAPRWCGATHSAASPRSPMLSRGALDTMPTGRADAVATSTTAVCSHSFQIDADHAAATFGVVAKTDGESVNARSRTLRSSGHSCSARRRTSTVTGEVFARNRRAVTFGTRLGQIAWANCEAVR